MDDSVHTDTIPSEADAVRVYVLSPAEEQAYFAAAAEIHQDFYDLGRLILLQGCRPMGLLTLAWEHVDFAAGRIRIADGKSANARRRLKLAVESRDILARRAASAGSSLWAFPGRHRA